MKRFFTLTLLSALMLTAGTSSTAQQRTSGYGRQETRSDRGGRADRAAANESFARANLELSKLTRRLGTDRKFADRFIEAARSHDKAWIDALLKESDVGGAVNVEATGGSVGEQSIIIITVTVTVCKGGWCTTATTTVVMA